MYNLAIRLHLSQFTNQTNSFSEKFSVIRNESVFDLRVVNGSGTPRWLRIKCVWEIIYEVDN